MLNLILQYVYLLTLSSVLHLALIFGMLSIISLFEVVKIDYMFSIKLHNRVSHFGQHVFLLIVMEIESIDSIY